MQESQKTMIQGYLFDLGLETQEKTGARSISSALCNDENDLNVDTKLMEEILDFSNLHKAARRVKSNNGAAGVDDMKAKELPDFLKYKGQDFVQSVLEGKYSPDPVRRVEIPKTGGGLRLLGIPTVIDRMLQQAVSQVLTPIFESLFSTNSYGFRPNRRAKDAINNSRVLINAGYTWTVDIDLEKYFDTVNHDMLMSFIAKEIKDKRVLKLIRSFLQSGIMIGGIKFEVAKGCPQGGPLSPLLSNIMLNEFDKELKRRGHKFSRYCDDSNIYVRSKRAGERVMQSITKFLEEDLKLKVNKEKSAVDRPWRRKFLGFSFINNDETTIRIHGKSIISFKRKVRAITSRSYSISMEERIRRLNSLIRGWFNYFNIGAMKSLAKTLDGWIRRRLRMCYWKQWKKIKTKYSQLIRLGISEPKARQYANNRKGYWRVARSYGLHVSLNNQYFKEMGLLSLYDMYKNLD